ncbi:tubby-like F-box protein 3 isoform X1 [Selaginella moellendorffii]|uniref:tubby-like F-box protein 3 isoform X1 n=1 Tax=Selaginella moellendorffii TaxID=88036 RepID=UPI000D1CF7BA|nr:tubby-like F-box protein 3 isoform X1 [Selaginella moellendorffii]|eukprot:XP_024526061.1 tubby-like F-box protein 3 isoform X1 [Selaginella moellendorffii]
MSGKKSSSSSSLLPLRSILREFQDIRDGIGSLSRRSFEVRLPYHHRSRSHSVVLDEPPVRDVVVLQQSRWASMPPELLRDVIQRLESSEHTWPARKNVVVCAEVCSQWRDIAKELVKTPEQSGKLTFPISLKQPGPRDATMQCFIKRDRATSTYHLCLGLSPSKKSQLFNVFLFGFLRTEDFDAGLQEHGKFLLAARKVRRATTTDYIISLDPEDFSRGSTSYVGKLRSNFLGTKFTIYDSQPPHVGAMPSNSRVGRRFGSKQISPRVPSGSYNVAHIAYELNVLGTRGPRRMQVTIHSIPASAMDPGGVAPTPTVFANPLEDAQLPFPVSKSKVSDCSTAPVVVPYSGVMSKDGPLVLKNKAPRWHDQLQCWCLNFRGRVTVASVKNFQLVAALEPGQQAHADHDKVLLQFGKIGKDMFTMDYRYPLSAFQAFGICLSSFDTKLACE